MSSLFGINNPRRLAGKLSARVSPQFLAAWIAVPFIYYGFVLGATFWIDGFCYSGLAAAFRDPDLFREFNSGWGKLSLGHLQPGIPALCWMLDLFPDKIQWPLLTILQRTVAFAALLWCCLEACNYRPTAAVLALSGFLAWNPFYQSFHNALLTESLNSSLLLSTIAISFITLRKGKEEPKAIAATVIAGCLATALITNIRSYYGLACVLMLDVACLSVQGKKKFIYITIISMTFVLTAFAYPTIRWIFLKDWYLPQNDMGYMLAAAWSSRSGGERFEEAMKTLSNSAQEQAKKLGTADQSVDYKDARSLAECLFAEGATTDQVSLTFRSLTKALNDDNNKLFETKVRKALISSGFIELGLIHFGAAPILQRGWDGNQFATHTRKTYLYHAWYNGAIDYNSFFVDKHSTFVGTGEGQFWFRKTHASYVKNKIPRIIRDPFLIALIPFDVWALVGLAGMMYLSISSSYRLSLILVLPIIISFVTMFTGPFDNPRYAYSLLPIYLVAAISATSTHMQRKRDQLKI